MAIVRLNEKLPRWAVSHLANLQDFAKALAERGYGIDANMMDRRWASVRSSILCKEGIASFDDHQGGDGEVSDV